MYLWKIDQNILLDCLGLQRFVPQLRKKAKLSKLPKMPGNYDKYGHNFIIFSQATGQTWNHKVCSFWSCALLALCSSERTCARESTFFILLHNSNFQAINSFHSMVIFPADAFHKLTQITSALKRNEHDQNEQTTPVIITYPPLRGRVVKLGIDWYVMTQQASSCISVVA